MQTAARSISAPAAPVVGGRRVIPRERDGRAYRPRPRVPTGRFPGPTDHRRAVMAGGVQGVSCRRFWIVPAAIGIPAEA